MKEIVGELWDHYGRQDMPVIICITTNGTVKKNGECVMGRGCAAEAKKRFPSIAKELGELIKLYGNKVYGFGHGMLSFPVKHNWYEQADLKLIAESARALYDMAMSDTNITYILPRPGCGNGLLSWYQVKPVIEFLPDNVWVISKG